MNRTTRRTELRRLPAILILAAIACSCVIEASAVEGSSAQAAPKHATSDKSKWTPANLRGLVPGKSRVADMKNVLGEPEGAPTKDNRRGAEVYKYPGKGELQGTLEISVRRSDNVIVDITERLPVALPRTPAYRRFGSDYRSVMYSRADCAGAKGAAPLYRDKRGQVEMIEYPAKGIALALDQYGYDIASVLYLSSPPGLATAPACVAREAKRKSKSGAKAPQSRTGTSATVKPAGTMK